MLMRRIAELVFGLVFAVLPDRRTSTADLVRTLRHFGRECAGELRRIPPTVADDLRREAFDRVRRLPGVSIVRITWPEPHRSHWVVYDHGRWLDPDGGRRGWQLAGGRATSYLRIEP